MQRDLKSKVDFSFTKPGRSICREEVDLPVVTSDDDSASTSRLVLNDLVSTLESLLVVSSPQLIGEGIGTDGAEVSGRAFRKNVLYINHSVSIPLD